MATEITTTPSHAIPYVSEPPLVGSISAFRHDRLGLSLRLAALGEVGGMHFAIFPMVQFNRPEYVHTILLEHANDIDKGRFNTVLRPFLGNGLLLSEGEFWRSQRKRMAPAFQPRQVSTYAESMVREAERLQQTWADGATIDLRQQMTALTMSIIGKILFDAEVFTEAEGLGAAITTILTNTSAVLSHLVQPPLWWPTPRNRQTRQAIAMLRTRMQQMIEERRAAPGERHDFLSLLIQARDEEGSAMSEEQVIDECLTLFLAGHETTAVLLTWAWYLLCKHPAAYDQVQAEVEQALEGRAPSVADLANLPYCLQVIKETLRLYPPAYMIIREAARDLEIAGYRVRKGTVLLVSPYVMHRLSAYFPDPERFDPERFTPEREKQLPRYAYLPFGAGPRSCIGNHLALMEAQLVLASLAGRARFTLVPGQTILPDAMSGLTLRPGTPVQVVVQQRLIRR